jgi:hypothetical protein
MAMPDGGFSMTIVLNEKEADALANALSMVYGSTDLNEIFQDALLWDMDLVEQIEEA